MPSTCIYKPKCYETSGKVIFDEDGDLHLIVGLDKITFIVCSRALARASRIFKRMLFGGFAESKPTGDVEWVVGLPQDDINGLHILMDIIHGNIEKVPTILYDDSHTTLHVDGGQDEILECEVQEILRGVAVVADKYDLVHLLHPWADSWLDQGCRSLCTRKSPGVLKSEQWCGNVIWCAWVFGDEKLLQLELDQVARAACLKQRKNLNQAKEGRVEATDDEYMQETPRELASYDAYGDLVFLDDPQSDENQVLQLLGERMIKRIETTRLRLLRAILQPVKAFYDKLQTHNLQCRLDDRQVTVWDYLIQLLLEKGIDILGDLGTFRGSTVLFYNAVLFTIGDLKRSCPLLARVIEDVKCKVDHANEPLSSEQPLVPLSKSVKAHLERQRQRSKIKVDWD